MSSTDPGRLLPETDFLLDQKRAAYGSALTELNGGDPLVDPPAFGQPKYWQVEAQRRLYLERERSKKINSVFADPQSGWGEVRTFMDGVFERYKTQNESQVIKVPKDENEALAQMQQMKPVMVDPNEVANIRQLVVNKLIPALKLADPRFDFWSDPRTSNYAQWLNRESGPGEVGFMSSGEQQRPSMGPVAETAIAAWQGIEGVGHVANWASHGIYDLGRRGIMALGGPDVGPSYPTNWIDNDSGERVFNAGKVPSVMDGLVMAWSYATNSNIEKDVAESGRVQQWEEATRAGFRGLVNTVSRGGGELLGMGPLFGAFGAVGQAVVKGGGTLTMAGLKALGGLRLAKGIESSKRALKIIESLGKVSGTAAGWAALESVNQGRIDGYGAAYLHGLAMSPVLMTLGALGKKTEWFAANRAHMPGFAARAVAGALEGLGFGGVETAMPEVLPASWGFIRNPNESTAEIFLRNMLTFALVKSASGRTFTDADRSAMTAFNRGVARAQLAEKMAEGKATQEEVAAAPIKDKGKLERLGKLSRAAKDPNLPPEERAEALRSQRELESELDREEFGGREVQQNVESDMEKILEQAKLPEQRGEPTPVAKPEAKPYVAKGFLPKRERIKAEVEEELAKAKETEVKPGRISEERYREIREGVTMEGKRGTSSEMLEVRGPAREAKPELLPEVPREGDAEVAKRPPAEGRGETARERAELREGLPESRKAGEEALRAVRGQEEPDASRRLREAAGGEVAVPGVPSGAPSRAEMRIGEAGPHGVRSGPGSFQQPPTTQMEPTPGVEGTSQAEIFAAMGGRPGRGGLRIPGTATRLGGDRGDFVQTAMRFGKVLGRGVEGFYNLFGNLARVKGGRDIVVGSHEWSHAMHRRIVGGGGRAFSRGARGQMAAVMRSPEGAAIRRDMDTMLANYPNSQNLPGWLRWAETWAEWHARNLLGEVGLDAQVPALSRFMRSWLAEPRQEHLREQYYRIQGLISRYNQQGARGRLRQSQVSGARPLGPEQRAQRPNIFRRAVTALNKAMLDDMAQLKQSQDRWLNAIGRRPEDVTIMDDPARMIDTLGMTVNKVVEHFVLRGIRLPGSRDVVPGLASVMDAVRGREQDFQDYVVAIRNMDLFRHGRSISLTPEDLTHSVRQITEQHPDFVEIGHNLKRWTDALIDWVAMAGNISHEDAAKIKDKYVIYVPFFRHLEGPAQHGQGRGVAERGTGLARIEGIEAEVVDPFVKLQQVARSLVAKAHQHQVMESLYKMAMGYEAGGLASVVNRTNVPKEHPLHRVLDAIEQGANVPAQLQDTLSQTFDALRQADALDPQTITLFSQKIVPTGERSIIAVTPRLSEEEIMRLTALGGDQRALREQNGKLQWMEVDARAYEALMGVDKLPQLPSSMQTVLQWAQAPRDLFRFFATGVQPAFVAANMIRDAFSAPLFDRNGDFRPLGGLWSLFRGAIEYHRNGAMRELYEELGAKSSSFWTEGRQRSLIGEQMTLWQRTKSWADNVQNWFAHPENYIRMDAFRRGYREAIAEGRTEQEARLRALEAGREITVNFARAGVLARVANQFIPYFNAGLQGQRKLWGALLAGGVDTKGDEAKARIQRGILLNGIANITVPTLAIWAMVKDEDWYQDLPEWRKLGYVNFKVGDQIVSIPTPFEAGVLFGGIPQLWADRMFGKNPAQMKSALASLAGPYLEVGNMIPTILKPILEVATGHNFFTGRPLTPEWIERGMPRSEQSTFYTTETAKVMSKAIGGLLTPIQIEQLTGGYTAGAGIAGMRAIDELAGLKDHPGIAVNPFVRFFKQTEHGQSDFVDKLYDLSVRLEQNEETLAGWEKGLKAQVDTAKRHISDLRKRQRAGEISREEAEKRSYELARPLVEKSRQQR